MDISVEKMRSAAAKFYKADFHVHSPLSHDWQNTARPGYAPNNLLNRIPSIDLISRESLDAYLEYLVASEIDIVAITDHMKYSFGVALAAYAQEKNKKILILPGIELNVRFTLPLLRENRIHLLAIFPPTIGKTKIDSIFPPDFSDENNRNGQEEVSYDSIELVVQKIRDLNGFVIAAHINSTNGIRLAFTKQTSLILKPIENTEPAERLELFRKVGESIKSELAKMDGLQVTDSTDPIHYCDGDGSFLSL